MLLRFGREDGPCDPSTPEPFQPRNTLAGWGGKDCGELQLRPCTNRFRQSGNVSMGHVDINGRDLGWTTPNLDCWIASRCAGEVPRWVSGGLRGGEGWGPRIIALAL